MKLIVGLGNPGPRYAESRHNVGFMVADELARRWRCDIGRFDRDFQGQIGETQRGAERVALLKPATYMNLSGQSVAAVCRFYKLAPADVLVVYDDLDLPPGALRIRASGSAGGHRGLESVLGVLKTQDVPRVRVGIGKVHRTATVEHVLGRFEPHEREAVEAAVTAAADAVETILDRGLTAAMNAYNRRRADESDAGGSPGGPA